MILAVDIGNTNITCGLYEDGSLIKTFRFVSDSNVSAENYTELFKAEIVPQKIEGAIVGSVVKELNDRVVFAVKNVCEVEPIIVSDSLVMPIYINVKNSSQVGSDRIANSVGAWVKYKKAAIVVDYGTATTFDILNSKGEFVGGIIAPGIKTQISSLANGTSLLDEFEIEPINKSIGDDTKSCILSGVIKGTASMTEGMLSKCGKELDEPYITIGTGGLVNTVSTNMDKKFDYIYPNLTLDGLAELYNLNK